MPYGKPIKESLALRMYIDHREGQTYGQIGRRYGYHKKSVIRAFKVRGWDVALHELKGVASRSNAGTFAPAPRLTAQKISQMLAEETKLRVPSGLKLEWRKWALERRGKFIARLRARLHLSDQRPETPFSANVEPYDYASPRAWEIIRKANDGKNSKFAVMKLNIASQGVIYKGELYYWARKAGYVKAVPWTKEAGRPLLHHIIWEEANGRPVPESHVLSFIDGNWNNLLPSNLTLRTRNDVARHNQAAALNRKSRELTSILLKRTQRKDINDNLGTLKI